MPPAANGRSGADTSTSTRSVEWRQTPLWSIVWRGDLGRSRPRAAIQDLADGRLGTAERTFDRATLAGRELCCIRLLDKPQTGGSHGLDPPPCRDPCRRCRWLFAADG